MPLGDIAQLGERVLCKHEVVGSIPSVSTIRLGLGAAVAATFRTLVSRPLSGEWVCRGNDQRGPSGSVDAVVCENNQ